MEKTWCDTTGAIQKETRRTFGTAKNSYKIKLKAAGYRLVYRVEDDIVYVTVIAVGKRERSVVYGTAHSRM